jgi:GAF domain-containing protein
MTQSPGVPPEDDPLSSAGSEPLVPILRLEDGKVDPVALATWHEALSNTLSIEVPHDLLGLWLYPFQGDAVLIGPAALAQDALAIPTPAPYLKPEQLSELEEIIVRAGYQSAICLPVRFGKRDVGLLLVADLKGDRYGPVERVVLQCVAQRIGPMLGRIARQWTPETGTTSRQQERIAGLLQAVARANRDGSTAQRFLAAVSAGLTPLLPHEHMELLVQDDAGQQCFRLGEHPGGPAWSDPSLVISRSHLDIRAIFGARSQILVPDLYEDDRWPRGLLVASEPSGAEIRGIAGARLNLRGKSQVYLLVGSTGPDLYSDEDGELLALLGGLMLPQIAEFMRMPDQPPPRAAAQADGPAAVLVKIGSTLAGASDVAAATSLIATEAAGLLPFEHLKFALVIGGGRLAVLHPGDRRAILQSGIDETLSNVLQGSSSHAVGDSAGESRLAVPLRASGRVHGALIFSGKAATRWDQRQVDAALGLADIVAAHLDLLRRSTFRTPPYVPGWRQAERR